MSKGIITAVHEKRAVALKQDGTFVEMKNKNYEIGQRVSIRENSYRKYAAVAASLVFLFVGGISGYVLAHTATSYVYVDINPSLRLDINPFDTVITVVPLNEDAECLVQNAQVYNPDIRKCVENIIAASETAEYLNETNTDVEISVVSADDKVIAAVAALAEQRAEVLEITATEVTAEECEEALNAGISAGRLEAVKTYTEYFGGELEDNIVLLEELSIRKIYSEISSAEREVERAAREAERQAAAEQREKERAEREAERQAAAEQREKERAEREAEQEAARKAKEEQREKEKSE